MLSVSEIGSHVEALLEEETVAGFWGLVFQAHLEYP